MKTKQRHSPEEKRELADDCAKGRLHVRFTDKTVRHPRRLKFKHDGEVYGFFPNGWVNITGLTAWRVGDEWTL